MFDRCDKALFQREYPDLLKRLKIFNTPQGKATFHSLRHTFVTHCKAHGIKDEVVLGIVGHGSPEMAELYNHDKEAAKVITGLPEY